jgi:hypothetical protein
MALSLRSRRSRFDDEYAEDGNDALMRGPGLKP